MPPKPTCKVVKREGQAGARIAPKGCEVRTEVSAAGVKVRRNKAGSVKLKLKTAERSMSLIISSEPGFPESAMTDLEEVVDPNDDYGNDSIFVPRLSDLDRGRYREDNQMKWDTGASLTTMSTVLFARLFPERVDELPDGSGRVTVADGELVITNRYNNMTFYILVKENPDKWVEVTDTIQTKVGFSNLLGTTSIINQLGRLKVKFI